jgi:chemotaxis protein MotA
MRSERNGRAAAEEGGPSVDFASICGITLALLGIVVGMLMEGGNLSQIAQPTAALIVLGGTTGAVLLHFPMSICVAALRDVLTVLRKGHGTGEIVLARMMECAVKARRSGILSLDGDLDGLEDPFMRRALMLAVDGIEPAEVRQIMQLEIENSTEIGEKVTSVFEAAGGYAPTVGIIGAVLGLIQVMQHLDNISEVGRGIAVAFVATIYGVGLANLICLPIAGKLKIRHREEQVLKEMIVEGVVSLVEGMNPRMLEMKLRTFVNEAEAQGVVERVA